MKKKVPAKKAPLKTATKTATTPVKRNAKSWLDDPKAANTAAAETMLRNTGGRPLGADRLAFTTKSGTGKVTMEARCRPTGGKLLLSTPTEFKEDLLDATGHHFVSSAVVGLAAWALRQLKQKNLDLTILDADR